MPSGSDGTSISSTGSLPAVRSSIVPSATTRPRSTTTARSHRSSTRSSWCDENSTVAPRRASPTSTLERASTATRVEAGERLVEHEHVGPVDQRADQLHPLLVAEREVLELVAGPVGEAELAEPAGGLAVGRRPGEAAQLAEVAQLLEHLHRRVQAALLGEVAERRRASWSIGRPSQRTSPASRAVSPKIARIVVVLPAPLGPRNPVTDPGCTRERHAVERPHRAVRADETVDLQHASTLLMPIPNGIRRRTSRLRPVLIPCSTSVRPRGYMQAMTDRVVTSVPPSSGRSSGPTPRKDVVERLLALLHEGHERRCDLVVFPELALTTFFPRWFVDDIAEFDHFYETAMPGPDTQPLFDEARAPRHRVLPRLRRAHRARTPAACATASTPRSSSSATARSSPATARSTCPATRSTSPTGRSSTPSATSSSPARMASACGGRSAATSG